MGHIILAALCLWSCVLTVTPLLTEEQVARATNYIHQRFTGRFTSQYSYFVKFTEDECNRGLTDQVLQGALRRENSDNLFQRVNNNEIYEGSRIVAAFYLRHELPDRTYFDHSEYRLLSPSNNSPISRLLTGRPPAGCAIFYSQNSPCIHKCINHSSRFNIIRLLQTVNNLPQNKVFAFGRVYWYDSDDPDIWDSWNTFNDEMMPLYHCRENKCVYCIQHFRNGV